MKEVEDIQLSLPFVILNSEDGTTIYLKSHPAFIEQGKTREEAINNMTKLLATSIVNFTTNDNP